ESGKNWPRRGAFSLSTPKVRQAPRSQSQKKLQLPCRLPVQEFHACRAPIDMIFTEAGIKL
ncbi:MAG: hypothetical protein AB7E10_08005, partial [Burkholderiaceae bacterium]